MLHVLSVCRTQYDKGPMALMEACMVRLPFAASSGKSSVLHTLVESSVPVQTFGSDTVKVRVAAGTCVTQGAPLPAPLHGLPVCLGCMAFRGLIPVGTAKEPNVTVVVSLLALGHGLQQNASCSLRG